MKESIQAQGYRPIEGSRSRNKAWRPIAKQAFATMRSQRATKFFGIVALGILFAHGSWLIGQILFTKAASNLDLASIGASVILGDTREVLASFFSIQFFVLALAIATVGAGLVADEVESDVLSVYFSRSIRPSQYLLGKGAALGFLPLMAFLVPGLLLWFTALGVSPAAFRGELWGLALPTVGLGCFGAIVLSLPMLALSTWSTSHRLSAVVYLSFFLFAVPIVEGLAQAGYSGFGYLSPERAFRTLIDWSFDPEHTVAGQLLDVRARSELASTPLALLSLCVFTAASAALAFTGLRSRLN